MSNFMLSAFADEYGPTVEKQIEGLKINNIPYLEIRGLDDGVNISKISSAEAKVLKGRFDQADIAIWSIGSPFGKIKITDDFSGHLDLFEQGVENALILGAKCIRLFSFFTTDYSPAVRDEVFGRLSKFIDTAKGSGLILCHENEKGIYGDLAPRCAEIHKALPELKAVFDPANFVQCGQDTLEAWALLKEYIYYLHMKDALSDGSVVPVGKGDGNVPYILSEFSKMGGGILSVEPHLKVFKGLAELEADKKSVVSKFSYPTNEDAFNAAASAVHEAIANL